MKSGLVKSMLALVLVGLGLAFVASWATAWPSTIKDFQVIGTGTVGGTCQLGTLTPVCLSNSSGQVTGTDIVSGTYTLSLTAGPVGVLQSTGGTCFPTNSIGDAITTANGNITFKAAGWLCEEGIPSSPYHYDGTYRIDSGTGQFAAAAGGGSLTATFEKGFDAPTFLKIDGTIAY